MQNIKSKNRPYELQEYSPEWKKQFLEMAGILTPLFAENLVEIDHIGSTSIEGMLAKPQVDVLVVVKNLDLVKTMYKDLENAGFSIHGRGYVADYDEYVTRDTSDGYRLASIHILQEGTPKIKNYKNFRDYLRNNMEDREAYIKIKKDLYSSYRDNYAEYDRRKEDLMAPIKARAKEWAVGRSN